MSETSPKISSTARNVVTLAAARDDHLVRVPHLPVAAARQVIRSLLNAGLVEAIPAPIEAADFAWRTGDDGVALMLRATEAGLARISEPLAAEALPLAVEDGEADEAFASVEPGSVGLDIASPPAVFATGPLPASVAVALQERNEEVPRVTIEIDAGVAPLVNAFVHELIGKCQASCRS